MTASRPDNEALFHAARDIPDPDRRRQYVREACAGDESRLAHVEALLAAADAPDSLLDRPAAGDPAATVDQPTEEGPGTAVGPYKLLEQIGEGGFGVVFLAEQIRPVRRQVALKVLKPGMDTRQVVARFEAERQALAIMDHPNIARVLDGGATASGRPYFVMELVKGVPITDFCDQNRLTPRQRLGLFVDVCRAVQHAHQKGIIHRDLKPSNVLVSRHDATPVVKVIDFGVAKALGQELTDKTLFTGFAQMVGTPLYMSPEQAGLSDLDVDTRSDVYALGVLLYELLTGTTPFSRERFLRAGYDEIRRIIREEDPPKPSTRLSASTESLPMISAQRQTEPARLPKLVRGELDWVVMKALEKDRTRRYETAAGFAADVQRYLADEPVLACPPSAGYRLRKFARRNRGPVLAAALVLLALVGGVVGTTWQAVRAELGWRAEAERAEGERLAKLDAEKAREKEAEARRAAEDAENLARESEADSVAFSRFLVEDVLWAPRPQGQSGGQGIDVTVRQALRQAAERMSERFRGRPRAEAVARHDLGVTFRLLGDLAAAEEQLRKALALRREVLPPADPLTLNTQNSLAVLLVERGKPGEAIPLFEDTVAGRKAKLGPDHPHTLATMDNLANAYRTAGRLADALPLFQETVARMTDKLGPAHPDTLTAMNNLALAYGAAGRPREKVATLEKSVSLAKTTFGPDHPETLTGMNNLAVGYWEVRNAGQAIPLMEQVVELRLAKIGADHPYTRTSLHDLALMYTRFIAGPDFKPLYLRRLPELRQKQPADGPVWVAVTTATAKQLLADRNPAAAEAILRECLAVNRSRQPDGGATAALSALLGEAFLGQKKYAEAESLLLAAHEALKREVEIAPASRGELTNVVERLVQLYDAWDKKDKADEWRKRHDASKQGESGVSR
jgi:serine/threonine protein kinase/tetratricopeptide (TPR) repeat protein